MASVIERIRSRVRGGRYVLTSHAIEEMAADGLTEADVEAIVMSGRILRTQSDRAERRRYTLEGRTSSRLRVRAVCRFSDSREHVVVITVYEIEEA